MLFVGRQVSLFIRCSPSSSSCTSSSGTCRVVKKISEQLLSQEESASVSKGPPAKDAIKYGYALAA